MPVLFHIKNRLDTIHELKLEVIRKSTFSPQMTINDWNNLPTNRVHASRVDAFKKNYFTTIPMSNLEAEKLLYVH